MEGYATVYILQPFLTIFGIKKLQSSHKKLLPYCQLLLHLELHMLSLHLHVPYALHTGRATLNIAFVSYFKWTQLLFEALVNTKEYHSGLHQYYKVLTNTHS